MISGKNYFANSKIDNVDTRAIMDFLSSAENVNKMIIASEKGLPALTLIVEELENKFENSILSPLHHNGENKNAVHRQNVGRMVKYVMSKVGYVPVEGGLNEKARIPKWANSKYFSTATIYKKEYNTPIEIEVKFK